VLRGWYVISTLATYVVHSIATCINFVCLDQARVGFPPLMLKSLEVLSFLVRACLYSPPMMVLMTLPTLPWKSLETALATCLSFDLLQFMVLIVHIWLEGLLTILVKKMVHLAMLYLSALLYYGNPMKSFGHFASKASGAYLCPACCSHYFVKHLSSTMMVCCDSS